MEVGKGCRREAVARKMGGERCVLILSLTHLSRSEVCEQCMICNKELCVISKSPVTVHIVRKL